jgi:hypothetical protein
MTLASERESRFETYASAGASDEDGGHVFSFQDWVRVLIG